MIVIGKSNSMKDKIKKYIMDKLDIQEESKLHILHITPNNCEYLIVFIHEGILKTITLYPSLSNILKV
jgi:hypothetical protein